MEVALTFGSIGDIIAICQIAIQLSRALGVGYGDAGGSAKEYQDLRKDLDAFVQVLMQVIATYHQREFSPALNDLDRATQSVVDECGGLIREAIDRFVPKYHESLKPGGSKNKIKDSYKKVEWSLREKDRLRDLQNKLRKNSERLSLLIGLAARNSARVNDATLRARIEEVRGLLAQQQENHQTVLELLQQQEQDARQQTRQLDNIERKLVAQESSSSTILAVVRRTFNAVIEIKEVLAQVANGVINLQILASSSTGLRSLDPTRELPITFEDALGYTLEIPTQWIEDWEDFYSMVERRFRKRKGYHMVLQRQYALEENVSTKILDQTLPLSVSLRRGMKINMSMIFVNASMVSGSCPRCGMEADALEDAYVQCQNPGCGMRFCLQKMAVEPENAESTSYQLKENMLRMTLPRGGSVPVEPGDFQRVRLLTTEEDEPETYLLSDNDWEGTPNQLRELSAALQGSPLGDSRMANFAFEYVSLPASRVPSRRPSISSSGPGEEFFEEIYPVVLEPASFTPSTTPSGSALRLRNENIEVPMAFKSHKSELREPKGRRRHDGVSFLSRDAMDEFFRLSQHSDASDAS